jgi:hypothetical protein
VRYYNRSPINPGYLACEVVDVVERCPYSIDAHTIDFAFVLAIGGKKNAKPAKLSEISNSRITNEELIQYQG